MQHINANLIKQFLLEKGGQWDSLSQLKYQDIRYDQYLSGDITIDPSEFSEWLQEKQQNCAIFRDFLIQNHFLIEQPNVTEITSDTSLSCIQGLEQSLKKQLVILPAGDGFTNGYQAEVQSGMLIINGVYINQRIYLFRISRNNPFVIGYVDGSNQKYNEYLSDYYNRLAIAFRVLKLDSASSKSKVELLEQGKVHVLTKQIELNPLQTIAKRVHQYKYDDDYIGVSDR